LIHAFKVLTGTQLKMLTVEWLCKTMYSQNSQ